MNILCGLFLSGVLFLYGCQDDPAPSNVKTTVSKSDSDQVYIKLQAKNSPLQTVEYTKDDLPDDLISQLATPDESIAIANVLRAPCMEEWFRGVTLNQSIQSGNCVKSIDWIQSVDTHLTQGKTLQDVLFIMVAPGPFLSNVDTSHVSVIVDKTQAESDLLKNRVQWFLEQSINVKVYVDSSGLIHEMNIDCLLNGHKMSDSVDDSSCFSNNKDKNEVDAMIQTLVQDQQKPIWLIKGYRLSGFQSVEQLSRVLQLP